MPTISLNAAVNQVSDLKASHSFCFLHCTRYMLPFCQEIGKAFNVIWIYELLVDAF